MKISGSNYSEGSWWGNNTICKTIADINKILYYADKKGNMQSEPQRKILITADMIVSGEKEGPLMPSPKNAGMIISGVNPVCFDEAIATLMGFDINKIPTLKQIRKRNTKYRIVSSDIHPIFILTHLKYIIQPSSGWCGHIETNE